MFDPTQGGLISGEDIRPLLQLQGAQVQNQDLLRQMAMANAIRQPSGQRHSTVAGAILGGVGDLAKNVSGGLKEAALQKQFNANLGQLQDPSFFDSPLIRQMFLSNALRGGAPQDASPMGVGDAPMIPGLG